MSKLGLAAGRPSANRKAQALKDLTDIKGPMVRVNFELEQSEHMKLKVYAARERRSIAEILRELIDRNIPAQD